jgi:hypothetical protein
MKRVPWLLAILLAGAAQAEEFGFDAAEFEKQPFEFGGYLEFEPERAWLNQDSVFYQLNFYDQTPRDTLNGHTAALKLDLKYTWGIASLNLSAYAVGQHDSFSSDRITRFDEAYLSLKPDPSLTVDSGKVALKWGKGYAWNPVGFVERPKDPNDVTLAREGYTMLVADFIRHFPGDLQTIAFTPVLLPVSSQINNGFGAPDHLNVAAKLYLLYRDTDIDFTWLSGGSRTPRFGIDFSRNLTSALEIHGEWARIQNVTQRSIDADRQVTTTTSDATSYLLGLRYLTEQDTTWIIEYYRNGAGYTDHQMQDFYAFIDDGLAQWRVTGDDAVLNQARSLSQNYARANPGERYLYLRVSQKEPFNIVYFTPSVTLITNLDDQSRSLTPELLYTGITNLEFRLRAVCLYGRDGSEFGEKQNERLIEARLRYYF